MGNVSIDLSLANVWRSWYLFRKGKKRNNEIEHFSYYLEKNLYSLYEELNNGCYIPGPYRHFIVSDNKKRSISVASLRDRVVHRLIYEYLISLYDHTFYFDVWSCRKNKGLIQGIIRTQKFLCSYPTSFVWRADITKFFDNVDQAILIDILKRKISDSKTLGIIEAILNSYPEQSVFERERERVNGATEKAFLSAILPAKSLLISISMSSIVLWYIS